jgi:hypothetical protein
MIIAETVPIPHGGKPGTHDREPTIGLFDKSRVVLEICAGLAGRPGVTQLNQIKYIHASMRYNGRPVMAENNYGQDVSQKYVYNNPDSEREKGFDTGIGQFAESRCKPDA